MINDIPAEGKFIRHCLRMLFAGGDGEVLNNGLDWKMVEYFISYHEIGPFLYYVLKDNPESIPQNIIDHLKNSYYINIQKNRSFWDEFLQVYKLFEQGNIPLLPMKGAALIEDLYSRFPIRPMADIDVLVKEQDINRAEVLLSELGYVKDLQGLTEDYWRHDQCHLVFEKRGRSRITLEVHWGIDFKRKKQKILPELWDRVREVVLSENYVKLLSPEDTLFSLVLHARRFGKVLCIKNVLDTFLLLEKYIRNYDWRYVFDKCDKYELHSVMFFNIHQMEFIFNRDMSYITKNFKIPQWKKKAIQGFIQRNVFLVSQDMGIKKLYLKLHFLLYDTFSEPVCYIANVPKEQFSKFYNLNPYDKKNDFIYKWRWFYIPFRTIMNKFQKK